MARFHTLSGLRDTSSRLQRLLHELIVLPVRVLRRECARSALGVVFMARHPSYMRESGTS